MQWLVLMCAFYECILVENFVVRYEVVMTSLAILYELIVLEFSLHFYQAAGIPAARSRYTGIKRAQKSDCGSLPDT